VKAVAGLSAMRRRRANALEKIGSKRRHTTVVTVGQGCLIMQQIAFLARLLYKTFIFYAQ
jgi:hypothetical protein